MRELGEYASPLDHSSNAVDVDIGVAETSEYAVLNDGKIH